MNHAPLDQLIHPILLYLGCVLGAVGVALALPRKKFGMEFVGFLITAALGGALMLLLGLKAAGAGNNINIFFYVFGAVALGAALRVITHPRPVYSALYFILTIIATAGLFLLLSAEFVAFALIIVYAGAILITYLFVIMLATQAPTENDEALQAGYDTHAREPWLAAVCGFLLLGVLTTMMFRGVGELPVDTATRAASPYDAIAVLPGKVEKALQRSGVIEDGQQLARTADGRVALADGLFRVVDTKTNETVKSLTHAALPDDAEPTNIDRLGINLLRDHPMTIEIAGIILLMAMLGATVLARKQVDLEEMLKAHEDRRLRDAAHERLAQTGGKA